MGKSARTNDKKHLIRQMMAPIKNRKNNIIVNAFKSALLLMGLLMLMAACSSVSRMPTVRSYKLGDNAIEQDSLKGYVAVPNSNVWVKTLHSEDSIFVEIRTSDTLSLRSMLINGLSVWLDPQAKKKQAYGISFPAARAEMLKQLEESAALEEPQEKDSLPQMQFDHAQWVNTIASRQAVVTDAKGTRFDNAMQAQLYLDEQSYLVYRIRFAFAQMGIEQGKTDNFSVGIVSERHQPQLQGSGQSQMTGASDRYGRQQPQRPTERPQRMGLIPINGWIIYTTTATQ